MNLSKLTDTTLAAPSFFDRIYRFGSFKKNATDEKIKEVKDKVLK